MSSRYAKMRLERIEKMGEEMMEILPQVTKQKSATNSVSRLTWTVMNCAWCRRRKRLPRSLHEGDFQDISSVIIISYRGSEAAKLLRGNNSLWSKINP